MGERDGLFENLPDAAAPKASAEPVGAPRLRSPERRQIELRACDLESLLGPDHAARLVWAYVERLTDELQPLYDAIAARAGLPGHPPIDPRLMLALWLYATSEGIGSARELARLCGSHDAYRWLCGGVSVNYHTLGAFRSAQGKLLDELLTRNVAALAAAGVIDLDTLAQDGVRVRAAAGAASFRRRATVARHLAQARRVVERLKRDLHDDPEASSRRTRAATERAAREREARVKDALDKLAEIEAQRKRREQTNARTTAKQGEPRVSTTDPEARILKMPDGGFRPAYNMQIVSAPEQQIVVAVDVTASGSDRGWARTMLERVRGRLGSLPRRHLADGGFTKLDDIEWAHGEGVAIHCPPPASRQRSDAFVPRDDDGPGVAAWRRRMKSPRGKGRYKRRSIAECINARMRQRRLHQITVRGLHKARTVLLWFALAHNVLRAARLAEATA
jgi:transposase